MKEEYERKLLESIKELKKAWINCLDVFDGGEYDCNEYIVEKYPFEESFDEIGVIDWCDSVIEKVENKKEILHNEIEEDTINHEF